MTHKVVFRYSNWWGVIAGHRRFESLGANFPDDNSCYVGPFYPSEAYGFLLPYPYPQPV